MHETFEHHQSPHTYGGNASLSAVDLIHHPGRLALDQNGAVWFASSAGEIHRVPAGTEYEIYQRIDADYLDTPELRWQDNDDRPTYGTPFPAVQKVEVIDPHGRAYSHEPVQNVVLSLGDAGQSLMLFLDPKGPGRKRGQVVSEDAEVMGTDAEHERFHRQRRMMLHQARESGVVDHQRIDAAAATEADPDLAREVGEQVLRRLNAAESGQVVMTFSRA